MCTCPTLRAEQLLPNCFSQLCCEANSSPKNGKAEPKEEKKEEKAEAEKTEKPEEPAEAPEASVLREHSNPSLHELHAEAG